jgi:hypothetical protein
LDRVRLMFDKYQALDHHRESVRVCVSIYIYIYIYEIPSVTTKKIPLT